MTDSIAERLAALEAENAALTSRVQDLTDYVENAVVALHWVNRDGTILWANQAELDLLGFTSVEYTGRHVADFYADRPVIEDILKRLSNREILRDYPARLVCKDGSIRHVLISSSVRWDGDQFLHTRCFTVDVTERKRFEDELRVANARLQVITDNIPAAVTHCTADQRYRWVSQGYAEWIKQPVPEIQGRSIKDVIGERGYEEIRPYIERVLSGERVEYTTQIHFNGPGERWIHVVYVPTYTAENAVDGWLAVVSDITDQREMQAGNAHLASMIQHSEDAIISKDLNGKILTWNAAAERIYGYSAAEAIGEKALLLLPPERAQEETDILMRMRRGEAVSHFDTTRLRRGGAPIEVSLTISPIRDSAGHIIGISHVARDITERKHIERQLRQTQRLESLGVLAGGIAHDFNNLLTGILGNASLALESVSSDHPARLALRNALTASERAADLTKQLLAYAGKGRFVIEPINLSAMIEEISELIQASIPRSVQLRLDLQKDLPHVEADTSQLQQLIMNLVINGAEALGEERNGTVLVTTGVQEVDEAYIHSTVLHEITPGTYVFIEVHDSGCGMDEATVARIFDPFFTTKFTGRGLGLSAVQGIVRGHKGALKVYSQVGKGSTFKVLFPITGKERTTVPPQPNFDLLGSNATVLVIDDEQIIRQTAKAMLERYGYTVLVAENGKEGLDLFKVLSGKIALVILDMTMPVMSGEETLRHLKLFSPEVKVLLSSGHNESEAIRRFAGKGLAGFLQKPYSAIQLAHKVKAALQ
jgi:PAS domain S-box-containing protein